MEEKRSNSSEEQESQRNMNNTKEWKRQDGLDKNKGGRKTNWKKQEKLSDCVS